MSALEPIGLQRPARERTQPRTSGLTMMQANVLMLLAAAAWGAGNVSQKLILEHMDPFAANGITCLIGAVALCPLLGREMMQDLPKVAGSIGLLLRAAVTFAVASTLMQIGYGQTTVTNAGFLGNTAAVMTPIIAWILYRQRPAIWIWPASFCSMIGVFLMGGGGLSTFAPGDVISLGAAGFYAIWAIFVGQFVMRCRRSALLTVVQLFVCGCACLVLSAVVYGWPSGAAVLAAWREVLLLGLVTKGLAYALMAKAQEHVPPSVASILVSAEAVFGAVAASLFLGEVAGLSRLAGACFIVVGLTIAALIPPDLGNPGPRK